MTRTPTRKQLEDAWWEFLDQNTPKNVTVVHAEAVSGKQGPRPQKPFITIKFINGPQPKNFDDVRYKGDAGAPTENKETYTLAGLRQRTVSIKAHGQDSDDHLALIQALLDDQSAISVLKQETVSIVSRGQVLDISELIDTGYERRHVLDVIFNTSSNVDVVTGSIEKAGITGRIKDADGSSEIEKDFEVPAT